MKRKVYTYKDTEKEDIYRILTNNKSIETVLIFYKDNPTKKRKIFEKVNEIYNDSAIYKKEEQINNMFVREDEGLYMPRRNNNDIER